MQATAHETLPFVDTDSLDYVLDPAGALKRAGVTNGIARAPHGVEIFGYNQVLGLINDLRLRPPSAAYFQGRGATAPILEFINNGLLLMMDPERHARVRRVMIQGFVPRTIEASRPMMAELAHKLLDGMRTRNSMDAVGDFSHHYSVGVISRFIGVEPEDIPIFEQATVQFSALAENPMTPHVPRFEKALADLKTYTQDLVARRRRERRADFISDLITAQESEGSLTEIELVWAIANVLLAGHDTTRAQIASCVRVLVEADAWEKVAADPALVPRAIEESMRLWPVTSRLVRLATEPVVICGESFKKDEPIAFSFHAAARDPAVFSDPNTLKLDRTEKWELGFGRGTHKCLGHSVATAEMSEALKVLTQRLTQVKFNGEVVMPPGSAAFMRGPESVPISFQWR